MPSPVLFARQRLPNLAAFPVLTPSSCVRYLRATFPVTSTSKSFHESRRVSSPDFFPHRRLIAYIALHAPDFLSAQSPNQKLRTAAQSNAVCQSTLATYSRVP